ncbi:MAG TPA: endonuclease/exonuclease/phosphatase family protein [Pyrinomonadaceae bacterium]|nr:endonuclease/exonuclease/phosphatase family protein [Pyrinomonadaceae bacterium]
MTALNPNNSNLPSVLDHDLAEYFPELLKFESTPEMERSDLYVKIRPAVERILSAVVCENLSEPPAFAGGMMVDRGSPFENIGIRPSAYAGGSATIRALAWNIERGSVFDGILDALKNNEHLNEKDVLLLTELDYGMARSGNRFVARELARALGLNYAFAPVYIALQKGSGVESQIEGENTKSIHGLAMFSRWPMKQVHAVPLPNGKDKMWGKEKRLGHLRALMADIEHPGGTFRAVTIHLDAHCSREHRRKQMQIILDHLDTLPCLPTILGGDWNTTTFNSQNATRAILGYWRRVFMGPKHVVKNHFPHPERYFEKNMFDDLERQGFEYKSFNEIGVGTLHYELGSIEKETNLRDWVPAWCFPFIFRAAKYVGGRVTSRLDWFAGRGIELANGAMPHTIGDLMDPKGVPLSDHDAITLDFQLQKLAR